jgi:hypothetical protein
VQHAPVGTGQGCDHVDLGDINGENQLATQIGVRDGLGLKVVNRHSAIDALLHDGDDLVRRFLRLRHLWGIPVLFFNYLWLTDALAAGAW